MPNLQKQLGITVLPEFLQNEGIDAVLDNVVERAGATAVATSPYVMTPADAMTGSREPPDDAGAGNVRLLDRPLWGKRELFVQTAPSFTPDASLYRGLEYQPAQPTELTRTHGDVIARFIRAAQARHLKVYLQVQAAIPPGYRVQFGGPREDDLPRRPDGKVPDRRVSKNGSLASEPLRKYLVALVTDLLRQYPEIDGIRLDWPEYPPYFLDECFLDFSEPALEAARRLGFDAERMRRHAQAVFMHLHGGLTNATLDAWYEADGGRNAILALFRDYPGLADLLQFKALLVDELLAQTRETITRVGGSRVALVPNAFAPPWTIVSGFDFRRAARHCQGASTKSYTMHWAMMLNFYGTRLLKANPRLNERKLVRTLVRLLDLDEQEGRPTLQDYAYPEPDAPHPVSDGAIARKLKQATAEAGPMPVYALAHGYGPLDDFRRRFTAAWQASRDGAWINRYGYLSDAKLDAVGEMTRSKSP